MLSNRLLIGLSLVCLIHSFGYANPPVHQENKSGKESLEKRSFWRLLLEDQKDPRSRMQLAYDQALVTEKEDKQKLRRILRNKFIGEMGILVGIGIITIGSTYLMFLFC